MKLLILCGCLMVSASAYAAETDTALQQAHEPTLHDYYISLRLMQERIAGRSLEEQAKMQPQMQRIQGRACEQLRKDRRERIPREDYRRKGGDEFLVFSLELEQWCQTGR